MVVSEIVPEKLPIPGELQLTVFPRTVHSSTVEVEKQGEPVIVMLPETAVAGSVPDFVTVKEKAPDETTVLLTQIPFQICLRFGNEGLLPGPGTFDALVLPQAKGKAVKTNETISRTRHWFIISSSLM